MLGVYGLALGLSFSSRATFGIVCLLFLVVARIRSTFGFGLEGSEGVDITIIFLADDVIDSGGWRSDGGSCARCIIVVVGLRCSPLCQGGRYNR